MKISLGVGVGTLYPAARLTQWTTETVFRRTDWRTNRERQHDDRAPLTMSSIRGERARHELRSAFQSLKPQPSTDTKGSAVRLTASHQIWTGVSPRCLEIDERDIMVKVGVPTPGIFESSVCVQNQPLAHRPCVDRECIKPLDATEPSIAEVRYRLRQPAAICSKSISLF